MRKLEAKIINPGPLTPKETDVLKALCEGCYRKQISFKLHRSLSVVNKHIESIHSKLNVHNNNELISVVVGLGMVQITIHDDPGVLMKCIVILLMLSALFCPQGARAPVRTARPNRIGREYGQYA